jgi:hypothetical protein
VERVANAGGRAVINSTLGSGTQVRIQWPVDDESGEVLGSDSSNSSNSSEEGTQ